MNVAAFHSVVLDLALSRNSFQCLYFALSIVLVHSLRFVYISLNNSLVCSSSFPLVAQLSCHFLRALLTLACCCFSSGVNHLLEYGDGLSRGVCFPTACCTAWISLSTLASSCVVETIGSLGSIAASTSLPTFAQSVRSYAFRGLGSGLTVGLRSHSRYVPL